MYRYVQTDHQPPRCDLVPAVRCRTIAPVTITIIYHAAASMMQRHRASNAAGLLTLIARLLPISEEVRPASTLILDHFSRISHVFRRHDGYPTPALCTHFHACMCHPSRDVPYLVSMFIGMLWCLLRPVHPLRLL